MTVDRVGGITLAVFAAVVLWESRVLPLGSLRNPGPAYMPVVLSLLLLGFGVLTVVFGARSERLAAVGWTEWRHAVAILATCAFAALAIERLGYRLTIFAALLFLLGVVERRGWRTAVIFAVVFPAASFYLFATMLRVPLPRGPWGL